jgi:hypothetical protein
MTLNLMVRQIRAVFSVIAGDADFTLTLTVDRNYVDITCSTQSSLSVNVEDITDPTISCVSNQTRDADAGVCTIRQWEQSLTRQPPMIIVVYASVTNDFNGLSTLAGAVFPAGLTTVIWTITDNSGNTATCTFYSNGRG